MKLTKAIEILQEHCYDQHPRFDPDTETAIELGIEAIKWRLLMEHDYGSWCGGLLPGETEE